jgi:hypothetical protein
MHFETGRDHSGAAMYLQFTAENAQRHDACPEARAHFERAPGPLGSDWSGQQRKERELELRIGLDAVTAALRGWGAPDVEQTYSQPWALAQNPGDPPRTFPALPGLWLFSPAEDQSARLMNSQITPPRGMASTYRRACAHVNNVRSHDEGVCCRNLPAPGEMHWRDGQTRPALESDAAVALAHVVAASTHLVRCG